MPERHRVVCSVHSCTYQRLHQSIPQQHLPQILIRRSHPHPNHRWLLCSGLPQHCCTLHLMREQLPSPQCHQNKGGNNQSPISPEPHQTAETVSSFKYLRVTLYSKLTFNQHIANIQRRSHQRPSAICKLKQLYVAPHLPLSLYQSVIQPISLCCSTCLYNMFSVKNWTKLTHITCTATRIIGLPTPNLTELNNRAITRIALSIEQDSKHPLDEHLALLPSGRRYKTLRCRRATHQQTVQKHIVVCWFQCFCMFLWFDTQGILDDYPHLSSSSSFTNWSKGCV